MGGWVVLGVGLEGVREEFGLTCLISVHDTAMEIERHGKRSNDDLLTTFNDLNESMNCELGILISVYIITCHPAKRRRT
jgi:hypothetical protein